MTLDLGERLSVEVELLESMYPEQLVFNDKARELIYNTGGSSLKLRIPDGYLLDALPEVLSASAGRTDLRSNVKQVITACTTGEEILDSVILAFKDLSEEQSSKEQDAVEVPGDTSSHIDDSKATIIVWLHHLLNTNKRKQALSPALPSVSGITKPGYPGVLVYSGSAKAVHEHVNELRALNWQAFQVRLESDDEWGFSHGTGVVEVESMKDVVADVGEENKQAFMEAMKIK